MFLDRSDANENRLDWSEVLDALCEPVLGVEPEGSIVFSNRAARQAWGYSVEEMERVGLSGLFAEGREKSCSQGILQEVLRAGQCQGDFLFQRKRRREIPGRLERLFCPGKNGG